MSSVPPSRILFAMLFAVLFSQQVFAADSKTAEGSKDTLWESYGMALKNARADSLPIFVEFYADWCVPCRVMAANVFTDARVIKILKENFHSVRLNVESKQEVFCEGKVLPIDKCYSEELKLQGLPAFVILDYRGISMLSFNGAFSAESLERFLNKLLYEGVH